MQRLVDLTNNPCSTSVDGSELSNELIMDCDNQLITLINLSLHDLKSYQIVLKKILCFTK